MESFAAMVTVTLTVTAAAGGEKVFSCCQSVSNKEFAGPIAGYRLQERKLPCVKAVIFETEDQRICTYWRAPWVRRKIEEFRRAQRSKSPKTSPSATPPTVRFSTLASASFRSSAPESGSLSPPVASRPSVPESSAVDVHASRPFANCSARVRRAGSGARTRSGFTVVSF